MALLLVGAAFRCGGSRGGTGDAGSCSIQASLDGQWEASASYIDNVIRRLEGHGAHVNVLISMTACNAREDDEALALLQGWFAPRVSAASVMAATGVGWSWLHAYELLERLQHKLGIAYDFVLRSRLDMYVEQDITQWRGDFSRLLFQRKGSICDERDSTQLFADDNRSAFMVESSLASRPECQLFVRDLWLWSPSKWLPQILDRLREDSRRIPSCMKSSIYNSQLGTRLHAQTVPSHRKC